MGKLIEVRVAIALALILPLAGAVFFYLMIFQPFASGAGGCGGG